MHDTRVRETLNIHRFYVALFVVFLFSQSLRLVAVAAQTAITENIYGE